MVTPLASTEDHMLCGRMRESFLETATSAFVTPCPILSLMMYLQKIRDRSMPIPGRTSTIHPFPALPVRAFKPVRIQRITDCSRTAAPPAAVPTARESNRSFLCIIRIVVSCAVLRDIVVRKRAARVARSRGGTRHIFVVGIVLAF